MSIAQESICMNRVFFLICFVTVASGCSMTDEDEYAIFTESYDFTQSVWGWQADFTDYPVAAEEVDYQAYKWEAEYTDIPATFGQQKGLKLSCENVCGDVFMFIKKRVTGLHPNTSYNLVFEVDVIVNAEASGATILKAGASFVEPQKVLRGDRFELNLDKGGQTTSGNNLVVIGKVDIPFDQAGYGYTTLSNVESSSRYTVTSNNLGEVWLVIGTESDYVGENTIYYRSINVVFSGSN